MTGIMFYSLKLFLKRQSRDIMRQCNNLVRFDSPQETRGLIPSIVNFVYKLLHALPNDLRLR